MYAIEKIGKEIPQILNGASANTLYYLINRKKVDEVDIDIFKHNTSNISYPHDLDDLRRCICAKHTFDWQDEHFLIAENNAKDLDVSEKVIKVIQNFGKLESLYNSNADECKKLLDELINKKSNITISF